MSFKKSISFQIVHRKQTPDSEKIKWSTLQFSNLANWQLESEQQKNRSFVFVIFQVRREKVTGNRRMSTDTRQHLDIPHIRSQRTSDCWDGK